MYGMRTNAQNLRPRRPRDYGHLHATLEGAILSQHSLKNGIRLLGQAGFDAVLSELSQLHNRKVMKDAKSMSREEKKAAKIFNVSKIEKVWKNKGSGLC
jgi:hypothetical protein